MIKKLYIFLIIGILISSCGKKGDPIYEQSKFKDSSTKINVVL